jgi:hypothetical protein
MNCIPEASLIIEREVEDAREKDVGTCCDLPREFKAENLGPALADVETNLLKKIRDMIDRGQWRRVLESRNPFTNIGTRTWKQENFWHHLIPLSHFSWSHTWNWWANSSC